MALISIIMPVRNAMPYLIECLDSIINQSYIHWELLAVNDHSEDLSETTLLNYAAKDNRIRCYQNTGKGIIDALNTGYVQAKGEFITRMDADDLMPKIKLEQLNGLLLKSGHGCLSTGKIKYISESILGDGFKKYENWLNRLCDDDNHYRDIYRECVIPSPCWMMYREDFESIGGFASETYPEDYDLCFRMYENDIKVVPSHNVLHIWRDHGQRASRNDENYSDNRFLDLKVKYFLRNDYHIEEKLVLWGAGKKGKQTAKLLIHNNIAFEWLTNNVKKIGKHIYSKKVEDSQSFKITDSKLCSFILAVANEEEQKEIIDFINQIDSQTKLFRFC